MQGMLVAILAEFVFLSIATVPFVWVSCGNYVDHIHLRAKAPFF